MNDVALVEAIKSAMQFVDGRDDWNPLTREEVDQFKALSERVFILAVQSRLEFAIPQTSNLERQCHDENLPPVQFEGKLNLPGDWDFLTGKFEPVAHYRWLEDMQTLLRLAEQSGSDAPRVAPAVSETEPPSLDEQAMAIFLKYKCSKAEIARRLGKQKQSLTPERCPQLDAAVKAWKASKEPGRTQGPRFRHNDEGVWDEEQDRLDG